jgi:hypothetical protein
MNFTASLLMKSELWKEQSNDLSRDADLSVNNPNMRFQIYGTKR